MNWQTELEKKLDKVKENEDLWVIIEDGISQISKHENKSTKINVSLYKKVFELLEKSFLENNWSCCNSCLRFIWTLIQNENLKYSDIEESNIKILFNTYYSTVNISQKNEVVELEFATLLRNITGFFMSWIDEYYLFSNNYEFKAARQEYISKQLPIFIKDKLMLDKYIFSLFELFTMIEPKRSNCNSALEYLYIGHSFILAGRYAAETYTMIQQIADIHKFDFQVPSTKMVNCIKRFLSCPDFDLQLILGELIWRILKKTNYSTRDLENGNSKKIDFIEEFRSSWPEGLIQLKYITAENFDYSFKGLLTPWNKTCNANGKNIWSLSGVLMSMEGFDITILITIDICAFSMCFNSDIDENECNNSKSSNSEIKNFNEEKELKPFISTAEIPYWTIQSVVYIDTENKLCFNIILSELIEIKQTWTGLFATNIENLENKNQKNNDIFKIIINIDEEQAYHIMGMFKASKIENIQSNKNLETPSRKISIVNSRNVSIEQLKLIDKKENIIESVENCYENLESVKTSIATSKQSPKKKISNFHESENEVKRVSFVSSKDCMKSNTDSNSMKKKKNKADVIIIGLINEQKKLTKDLENNHLLDLNSNFTENNSVNFLKNEDFKNFDEDSQLKNDENYKNNKSRKKNSKVNKQNFKTNNKKSIKEKKRIANDRSKNEIKKTKNFYEQEEKIMEKKIDEKIDYQNKLENDVRNDKTYNSEVFIKNQIVNSELEAQENLINKDENKIKRKKKPLKKIINFLENNDPNEYLEKDKLKDFRTIETKLPIEAISENEKLIFKDEIKVINTPKVSINDTNKRVSGLKRGRVNKAQNVDNIQDKKVNEKTEFQKDFKHSKIINKVKRCNNKTEKTFDEIASPIEKTNYSTPINKNTSEKNIYNHEIQNKEDSNKILATNTSNSTENTTCPTRNAKLEKIKENISEDKCILDSRRKETIVPPEIAVLDDNYPILESNNTLEELEMKKRKYSCDERSKKLFNKLYSEIKGDNLSEITSENKIDNKNEVTPSHIKVKKKQKKNIKKKSKSKIEKIFLEEKSKTSNFENEELRSLLSSENQEMIVKLLNNDIKDFSEMYFPHENEDSSLYTNNDIQKEIDITYNKNYLNSENFISKEKFYESTFSPFNPENSDILTDYSNSEKANAINTLKGIPDILYISNLKLEENEKLENMIDRLEECSKNLYSKCKKRLEMHFLNVKRHLESLWIDKIEKYQQKKKELNNKVELARINIQEKYEDLYKKYTIDLEKISKKLEENKFKNNTFEKDEFQKEIEKKVMEDLKIELENERKLMEENIRVFNEKKEIEKNKYKKCKSKKLNLHQILKNIIVND